MRKQQAQEAKKEEEEKKKKEDESKKKIEEEGKKAPAPKSEDKWKKDGQAPSKSKVRPPFGVGVSVLENSLSTVRLEGQGHLEFGEGRCQEVRGRQGQGK